MSTITDWLMVGITFIYVAATIAIWCANKKSAQMTEKQLEESKKQFEESKRLGCMPFLQLELCIPERASFASSLPAYSKDMTNESTEIVKFRNLGNGTAINLVYTWECAVANKSETACMPICAIQKEDTYYWQMDFETDDNLPDNFEGRLCFEFNDLLGNTYEQTAILSFSCQEEEVSIENCDMDIPKFLGVVFYSLAKKPSENAKE